jgi:hypothetical protein
MRAETLFIVRRACRLGSVTRADLLRAFGTPETTAGRLLREAEALFPSLKSSGRKLGWDGEVPPWASEAALLAELDGHAGPQITGLFEEELPVLRTHWTSSQPQHPGALLTLVQAISRQLPAVAVYVGMRKGERGRIRSLMPLAIEQVAGQWNLLAADLDAQGFPVKTFALSRIVDVKLGDKPPRGFRRPDVPTAKKRVPVRFNPELTADQRAAIGHALGVRDGVVEVEERAVFEFLRAFADQPPSEDAVWPPLLRAARTEPPSD